MRFSRVPLSKRLRAHSCGFGSIYAQVIFLPSSVAFDIFQIQAAEESCWTSSLEMPYLGGSKESRQDVSHHQPRQ